MTENHDRLVDDRFPLSIVVVGASGSLARTKILPALFALYCQGWLPEDFCVMGFSRTDMGEDDFRRRVAERLTCRYTPEESCAEKMEAFLSRCHYCSGSYDSPDAFLGLYQMLREHEGTGPANRVFYMAIPPFLFQDVAHAVGDAGLVVCGESHEGEWARAVIEKPFGEDRASSDALVRDMGTVFSERDTYRIDHYLGKELVQNLLVLRFANRIFETVWNREHVASVHIDFREDHGVEERGGYFDRYGIVRDVVQNHLLQVLALATMEPPARLDAHAIRDEKTRLLRAVAPLAPEDLVLGQFEAGVLRGQARRGYRETEGVAADSNTPTYAAVRLRVENERWRGVPFLITAGKGLDRREAEVRIRLRRCETALFGDAPPDEIVVRIQPDEGVAVRINNKRPGLTTDLARSTLDLNYAAVYDEPLPEAYECLLLDVLRGDKSLFIRDDELAAAWDIFTPALHALEGRAERPHPYPFGSTGPEAAERFAREAGFPREED